MLVKVWRGSGGELNGIINSLWEIFLNDIIIHTGMRCNLYNQRQPISHHYTFSKHWFGEINQLNYSSRRTVIIAKNKAKEKTENQPADYECKISDGDIEKPAVVIGKKVQVWQFKPRRKRNKEKKEGLILLLIMLARMKKELLYVCKVRYKVKGWSELCNLPEINTLSRRAAKLASSRLKKRRNEAKRKLK